MKTTNEKRTSQRRICPTCEGFAVRLCPWCKVDITNDNGKVIKSKPGQGCRACLGAGIFTCTQCAGKGYLLEGEIEPPKAPKGSLGYMPDY